MSGGGFRGRGFGPHRARFNSPGSGGRNNGPRNGPRHSGNYQRGNFNNSQSQPALLPTPGSGRRSGQQDNWSHNRSFPRWEQQHGPQGNNQSSNWSHNRGEPYQNSSVRYPYHNNDSYQPQGGRGHYRGGGRGRRGGGGSGGGNNNNSGGGDHGSVGDGGGYRYSEPRESNNYYNPPYYNAPYRELHQQEQNTAPEEPVPPLLGSEEERQQKITEAADELKRKLLTNRTTPQEETNWYEDFNIDSLSAADVEENVIKAIPELKHGPPELDLTLSDLKDIGRVDIDSTVDPSATKPNVTIQICDESFGKKVNQRDHNKDNENEFKIQKTPLITLDYPSECVEISTENIAEEIFLNKSGFDSEISFGSFQGMSVESLSSDKYNSNLSTEMIDNPNAIESENFDIQNLNIESNSLDSKLTDKNQAHTIKNELKDNSSNLEVCSVQNLFDSFSLAFNNSSELISNISPKQSDLREILLPNESKAKENLSESSSNIKSKKQKSSSYQEQITKTSKNENKSDVDSKNKKKLKKKSSDPPLDFDPSIPPPIINQLFTQNEEILQPPLAFDPRRSGINIPTIVPEFDPKMPPPVMGSQKDTIKSCSSFTTHLSPIPAMIPPAPVTGAPINMPSTIPGYAHPSYNPMVPYVPPVPMPYSPVIAPVEYPLAQLAQPPLPPSTTNNPPLVEQIVNKPETNGDPNLSVDDVLGEMKEAMEFAKQCMVMGDDEDVIDFPTLPNLPPLPEFTENSKDKSTKQKKIKKSKQETCFRPHPKSKQEKTEEDSTERALASIRLPETTKVKLLEEKFKIPEEKRKYIEEKRKLIEEKRKLVEEKAKFIEEKNTFTEEKNKVYEDECTSDDLGRRKVMFNLNAKFKKLNKTEEWTSESLEEEEIAKQRRLKILSSPAVAVVAPTTMTTTIVSEKNKCTSHEEKSAEIVKDSSSSENSNKKKRDEIQTRSKNKEKEFEKQENKNHTRDDNKRKTRRSSRIQPLSDSKSEKNSSHNELIAEKTNEVKTYTSKPSTKKATPALTESSWKNRVITRFLKMSKNDIQNMINNSSLRKFDIAMQHLVKEKKSSLSLEMRLNEDEKMKNSNYDNEDFMSQLQAILDPAATVDITNLPTTFIHQLSEVLHLDPLPTDLEDTTEKSESLILPEPSILETHQSISDDSSRHVTTNVPVSTNAISTYEIPKPRKINNKPAIDVVKNISTVDSSTSSRTRSKRNEVDTSVQRSVTSSSVSAPVPSVSTISNLNMNDLDDIFTAGIRAKSKPILQTASKVFTTATDRIVMPVKIVETTHVENNEIPTADLDKIFSAVIAKTKASSMKPTTATSIEPLEREESRISHRESPGSNAVTSWKRKGIDDPDNFRNLTKEEYEARYGDFSHTSTEDESKTVTFKSRKVMLNGRENTTYPVQTNKNLSSYTAPSNVQNVVNAPESGEDSGSEGETSSSSTSSSSSDEESLDVTKVLKFIKEREKIAKKKSINEEIRDEVSAEIERKRKEKNAKHKSHKSRSKKKEKKKKDKDRRGRKKKLKKKRKRKLHHSPLSNVSENEDGERPLWLLREDEIKREPCDEPLKDEQDPETSSQILPITSDSRKNVSQIVNTTTIQTSASTLPRKSPITNPNPITTNSTVSNIIKTVSTPSSLTSALRTDSTSCSSSNRSSQSPLPHTKTKAQLKQMPEALTKTRNDKPVSTETLNNPCTDKEPIKTGNDVNQTHVVVKHSSIITTNATSPTSKPRKLDIKQYQERTFQRKLREKERGRAVAENPSILTQDLLNLPQIKKSSAGENNQSNLKNSKPVANLLVNVSNSSKKIEKTLLTGPVRTVSIKTASVKTVSVEATPVKANPVEVVPVQTKDICKTVETFKTSNIPQRRKLIRTFPMISALKSPENKIVEENKFANIKSEGGKELKLKEKLKRKPSKPIITDVTVLSNKVAVPRSKKLRSASSSSTSLTSTGTSNADEEVIKAGEISKSSIVKKNAPSTRSSTKLKNLNKDKPAINIQVDESLNKLKQESSEILDKVSDKVIPKVILDPRIKIDIKDKIIKKFAHYFTPSKNIKSDGFPDVVTFEIMETRVEIRRSDEIIEEESKTLYKKEVQNIEKSVIDENKVEEMPRNIEIIEEKVEIVSKEDIEEIQNPNDIIEEKFEVISEDEANEIQNPTEIIEEKYEILNKVNEIITQNENENTIDILKESEEQLINPTLNEEMKEEMNVSTGYDVESIPITPQFDENIEKGVDMLAEDEKLLIECEEDLLNKQDIEEEEEEDGEEEEEENLLLEADPEENIISKQNIIEQEIISSEKSMEFQNETIEQANPSITVDDNFSENISLVSTFSEEIKTTDTLEELTTEQLPIICTEEFINDKTLSEIIMPEINPLSEALEKDQKELILNEAEILSKVDDTEIINTESDTWNIVDATSEEENDITPVIIHEPELESSLLRSPSLNTYETEEIETTPFSTQSVVLHDKVLAVDNVRNSFLDDPIAFSSTKSPTPDAIEFGILEDPDMVESIYNNQLGETSAMGSIEDVPQTEPFVDDTGVDSLALPVLETPCLSPETQNSFILSQNPSEQIEDTDFPDKELMKEIEGTSPERLLSPILQHSAKLSDNDADDDSDKDDNYENNLETNVSAVITSVAIIEDPEKEENVDKKIEIEDLAHKAGEQIEETSGLIENNPPIIKNNINQQLNPSAFSDKISNIEQLEERDKIEESLEEILSGNPSTYSRMSSVAEANMRINIPQHIQQHYGNNIEPNILKHVSEYRCNSVEREFSKDDEHNGDKKIIENSKISSEEIPSLLNTQLEFQNEPQNSKHQDKDLHKDDSLKKHRRSKSRTPTHDHKKNKRRHHHHRKKTKLTLEKVEDAIAADIVKPAVITKDSVMMRMQEIDLAIQKLMDEKMTLYQMLKDDKWPSVLTDEPSTSTDVKTVKPTTHLPSPFTDKLIGKTPRVVVARLTESAMKQVHTQVITTSPTTEFPLPKPESSSTPKPESLLFNKPSKTEEKKTKSSELNEHTTPKTTKKRKRKEEKDHKEDKEHKGKELKSDGSPDIKKRLHSEESHHKHKKSPISKNVEEPARKPFKLSQLLKSFKPKTPLEKRRSTSPKEFHRGLKSRSASSDKNISSSKELGKSSKNELEDSDEEIDKMNSNISSEKNKILEKDKKIKKADEIPKKSTKDHNKVLEEDPHLIYSDDSTWDHFDRFNDKSERSTGLVLLEESMKREKAAHKTKSTVIKKKTPTLSKRADLISSDTEDSIPLAVLLARKKLQKKKQLTASKKSVKDSNTGEIPKEDHIEEIIDAVATNRIDDLYDNSKKKQNEKSDKCLKIIEEKLADEKEEENKQILKNVEEKRKSERTECEVEKSKLKISVTEMQIVEKSDEINNKNNTELKEMENTQLNTSELIKPVERIEENMDEFDTEESISDEIEWRTLDSVGFIDDKDDEYEQSSDGKLETSSIEEENSNKTFIDITEKSVDIAEQKFEKPLESMISPLTVEENNLDSEIQDANHDNDGDNDDDDDDDDDGEKNPQPTKELQETLLQDWADSPHQVNNNENNEENSPKDSEVHLEAKLAEETSEAINSGVDVDSSDIIESDKLLDNNTVINIDKKELTISDNVDEHSLPTRIFVESVKFLNAQKQKKDEKIERENSEEKEPKEDIENTKKNDDNEKDNSRTQMSLVEKEIEQPKLITQEFEKSESPYRETERFKSTIKELQKYKYSPKESNKSTADVKNMEESKMSTEIIENETLKSTTEERPKSTILEIEQPESTTAEHEEFEKSSFKVDELEKLERPKSAVKELNEPERLESPLEELKKSERPKSTVKELEKDEKPKSVVKESKKARRPKSTVKELEKMDRLDSSADELKEPPRPKSTVRELKKTRRSKSTVKELEKLEESESSAEELKEPPRPKSTVRELKKSSRSKSTVKELEKMDRSDSSADELEQPQRPKSTVRELKKTRRPKSTIRELEKLEESESSAEELKRSRRSKFTIKELKKSSRSKSTVKELEKMDRSDSSADELERPRRPKSSVKELKKTRRPKSTVRELEKLEDSESPVEELKELRRPKSTVKGLKKPIRPKSTVRELEKLEELESQVEELEEIQRPKSTVKELKKLNRPKSTVKELEEFEKPESCVEESDDPERLKSTTEEVEPLQRPKSTIKDLEKSKASIKEFKEEKTKLTEMERPKSTVKELEKLKSKKIIDEDDSPVDEEDENEEPVRKKRDRKNKNIIVNRRSSQSSRQSDDSSRTSRSRSRSARLRKSPSSRDTSPPETDSKSRPISGGSTGSINSRRRSVANASSRETTKPDIKPTRKKRKKPNADDYDLDLLTKCKVRLIDWKLICHEPDLHSKFLQEHGILKINNWIQQEELLQQDTPEEELDRPLSVMDEDKNHSDDDSMELIQVEEADDLQAMDTLESLPDDNVKDADDQHKISPLSSEFTGSPQAVELPESDLEDYHEGEQELEVVESDIEVLEKQTSPVNTPKSAQSEDVESTELRRTQYTVHKGPILDIKVFGDSFLAASEDGAIYRYSQRSNGILNIYKGHDAAVTCLYIHEVPGTAESGNTRWNLFSGSLDATLRCYDIINGSLDRRISEIGSPIQCMDQAWGNIYIGTKSGHISRYDIKSGCLREDKLDFSDKPVLALRASTEGPRKILIVASRNQPITIRDAQNGLFLRTISGQRNHTVYSLLMDRNLVYCGTSNTSIPVFDFISGEQICQYTAGVGIVCMRLYRQLLFAGCYDGNIYVFDTKDQKLICSIPGPGNMLLSMEIIDDEIIAGSKDRRLHAWKMSNQIRSIIIDRT